MCMKPCAQYTVDHELPRTFLDFELLKNHNALLLRELDRC